MCRWYIQIVGFPSFFFLQFLREGPAPARQLEDLLALFHHYCPYLNCLDSFHLIVRAFTPAKTFLRHHQSQWYCPWRMKNSHLKHMQLPLLPPRVSPIVSLQPLVLLSTSLLLS